jgi:integrase
MTVLNGRAGSRVGDLTDWVILTVGELLALVAEMPDRCGALVLLTTFASLRWGEAIALQRRDVDLDGGVIYVRRAFVEVGGRRFVLSPPKSRAGRRVVALPQAVVPALRHHLAEYVGQEPDSFVFTGSTGTTANRAASAINGAKCCTQQVDGDVIDLYAAFSQQLSTSR